MATIIEQQPLYETMPIGQQVMFVISNNTIVANKFKVKFIAEVHCGSDPINLSSTSQIIGTFKTTPNNAGVGIFDLKSVLETFITPDHNGSTWGAGSTFRGTDVPHPIHIIDKCAVTTTSAKYFAVQFKLEFSETATGAILNPGDTGNTGNAENSEQYLITNGVLQYDDALTYVSDTGYGYNINNFIANTGGYYFLTNAPQTQYASLTDYGTLAFYNFVQPLDPATQSPDDNRIENLNLIYYNSAGAVLDSESLAINYSNGSVTTLHPDVNARLNYVGAYPANLREWSTKIQALITADTLSYYTVQLESEDGWNSVLYTINVLCPNLKGYEPIRLTWLNQWGVWDYYTFNMKSTKAMTTNRTSYTQQSGTWNESLFKISGYKGGKKNFRVNATERITLNTDFVTEAEGVWFEELINSTEVYIVNGYQDVAIAPTNTITNRYVEPVVVTTSDYIKKTIANDKLMQYTINIEKSKMQRIQAV